MLRGPSPLTPLPHAGVRGAGCRFLPAGLGSRLGSVGSWQLPVRSRLGIAGLGTRLCPGQGPGGQCEWQGPACVPEPVLGRKPGHSGQGRGIGAWGLARENQPDLPFLCPTFSSCDSAPHPGWGESLHGVPGGRRCSVCHPRGVPGERWSGLRWGWPQRVDLVSTEPVGVGSGRNPFPQLRLVGVAVSGSGGLLGGEGHPVGPLDLACLVWQPWHCQALRELHFCFHNSRRI